MPDLNKQYESKLLRGIATNNGNIQKVYEQAIDEITFTASSLSYQGNVFSLNQYPKLQKLVKNVLSEMHTQIYSLALNGINDGWDLANEKNNIIVDKRIGDRSPSAAAQKILYDPNLKALNEFIARKEKGLNLSDRVWNTLDPFPAELTKGLALGMSKGQAANSMATDLKQYLKNPDKLFRRIRDAAGDLKISKAARDYHPGQGVYRSSFKNARRLAATETNIAYRSSDWERWQTLPFVTGIDIKTSNNHPRYDICDELKGQYPKDFKFSGWHPQCICYQVPIQMTDAEYDKLEDAILAGEDPNVVSKTTVEDPPEGFTDFLRVNRDRINGWNSTPYWVKDNPEFVQPLKGEFVTDQLKDFNTLAGLKFNIDLGKELRKDSLSLYQDADGNFTTERQALHDQIIKDILSKGSTTEGTSFFLGGAPANGKSTLVESGLVPSPKGILSLDPDTIKTKLPEYNAMVAANDSTAAKFVHEESSFLGKEIAKRALDNDFDLLSDGVGDGKIDKLEAKIQKFKDAGQRTRADYVSLDTDLSIKLARARSAKTGREVPENYILDMNKEISKLIPQLIKDKAFDELYLWDTNLAGNPRLILSQIDGKLTIADQGLYNDFLNKAKNGR